VKSKVWYAGFDPYLIDKFAPWHRHTILDRPRPMLWMVHCTSLSNGGSDGSDCSLLKGWRFGTVSSILKKWQFETVPWMVGCVVVLLFDDIWCCCVSVGPLPWFSVRHSGNFFAEDTNPTGRVLNRFSADVEARAGFLLGSTMVTRCDQSSRKSSFWNAWHIRSSHFSHWSFSLFGLDLRLLSSNSTQDCICPGCK
jgi:hypothetical protein